MNQPAWDRERWGSTATILPPQDSLKEEGHIAMRLGDGPVRVLGLWWLSHAMLGELKARKQLYEGLDFVGKRLRGSCQVLPLVNP